MNITTTLVGLSSTLAVFDQLRSKVGGRKRYVVGTSVEYAPYVEYGTVHMRAQPYLRPAAQEVQSNVGRHVREADSLDAAVHSAAMDVERRAKQYCPVDTGTLRSSIRVTSQ